MRVAPIIPVPLHNLFIFSRSRRSLTHVVKERRFRDTDEELEALPALEEEYFLPENEQLM